MPALRRWRTRRIRGAAWHLLQWPRATCKKRAQLLPGLLGPPALQLGIDRRRAVDLRQRAFLLRLALLLPLGDERGGLGEGILERAAGGQGIPENSEAGG